MVDRRAVDHHIQPAEALNCSVHRMSHRIEVAHIAWNRDALAITRMQVATDSFGRRAVNIYACDRATGAGKGVCGRLAEAAARPSDQNDLALQTVIHHLLLCYKSFASHVGSGVSGRGFGKGFAL